MELEHFQKWDGRGLFLLRLDYGFTPWEVSPDGGWPEEPTADLDRQGWREAEEALLGAGRSPAVLGAADRLLDLARRRGGGGIWEGLARLASGPGLLLWARFPRAAAGLASALGARGLLAGLDALEPRGELPPLYGRLSGQEALSLLHLAHEWETGLARARATTVLVEAGARMAAAGELAPAALGALLGTTTGAARSYLKWMTEAGLARRTGGGYALRHPGLARRFAAPARPAPSPPSPARPQPSPRPAQRPESARVPTPLWHPEEMD